MDRGDRRLSAGVFGVVAAVCAGLQACGPAKPAGPPPLTSAQACLQTLDPATGVDLCRAAITDSPNDPALRRRLALLRLKAGSLAAARQAYQIAESQDTKDAEAQFGLGLTFDAIGQADGNIEKVAAAKRDPTVVDRFRKYGFSDSELLLFDTPPKIIKTAGEGQISALTPKLRLARPLGVDVRCQVAVDGRLHGCKSHDHLPPEQEPFGEAAEKIASLARAHPAKDKGAPVADAPVVQIINFDATG